MPYNSRMKELQEQVKVMQKLADADVEFSSSLGEVKFQTTEDQRAEEEAQARQIEEQV